MRLDTILKDKELRDEILDRLVSSGLPSGREMAVEASDLRALVENVGAPPTPIDAGHEAIVVLFGRPALLVRNDTFESPQSEVWRSRLDNARAALERAIQSVGRIELSQHPDYEWVGTGWQVADDIVVTNRHVASIFARRSGDKFVFRKNMRGEKIGARIDYREEHMVTEAEEIQFKTVLYIEDDDGPDMAFLRVEGSGKGTNLPSPIELADEVSQEGYVSVIGYPAWDGRRNDPQVMRNIFGDIYDVKRLQPGQVTSISQSYLQHDCSTLGGNSGSVVLDLDTGRAVGLHFAGRYLDSNYAVPAPLVADRLSSLS